MEYYFQCPKCGTDDEFVKPNEESFPIGSAILAPGGIFAALLIADHARHRTQCGKCAYIFRQPPIPRTQLASFARWMVSLTIILLFIAGIFFGVTDGGSHIPPAPVLSEFEALIAAKPRVAAWLIVFLVLLICIPCWIGGWISNAIYRKHLSAVYSVKPPPAKQVSPAAVKSPDQ